MGNEPGNASRLPPEDGSSHSNGRRSSACLPACLPGALSSSPNRPSVAPNRSAAQCPVPFRRQLPAVSSRGRGLAPLARHSVCMPRSVGAVRLRVQPRLGRDIPKRAYPVWRESGVPSLPSGVGVGHIGEILSFGRVAAPNTVGVPLTARL